jgi:hypothetical protein
MIGKTSKEISEFVNERWAGIYITHKYGSPRERLGQLWVTYLHGPDGPKVFTLEHPDGTLEDMTREYRG